MQWQHARQSRIPGFAASFALMLFTTLNASAGSDAEPRSVAANSSLPQVTVEGRRQEMKVEVRHFIEHITRPDFLDRSLARWLQPICPAAVGLPRDQGEYVLERLSTVADAVKAPLSTDAACKPNLFVVFTRDPDVYLKKMLEKQPFLFRGGGSGMNLASPSVVNAFLNTKLPVRVWYNTNTFRDEGKQELHESTMLNDGRKLDYIKNVRAASPRLWYPAVIGFESVIVVIDTGLTNGMNLATVVDYASMVGLMELQPGARVGLAPSIVSTFNGGATPAVSMTPWDTAFLEGLYETEQYSRGQRDLIADRMIARVLP